MVEALPIDARLPELGEALRARGVAVLVAEPGAGKTTRVPPYLVDAGLVGRGEQVIVLQPRRVAARAAAARIAAERGDEVGGFAGYQVRFDRRASAGTRVLAATEGILTRRLQDDPSLSGVGAVVLDEFHERSLHADLALALVKEVRAALRPELKLVVMSATLDARAVARYLDDAPTVVAPGRAFPLTTRYLDAPDDRPLGVRASAGVRRALDETSGDVLVFLPGLGEIARAAEALAALAAERDLIVAPLHGELRAEEQDRALRRAAKRKIVLATNVAETSVTVEGVAAVVDLGYARVLSHDPDHGLDRLELRRISRASAAQRAGRAGRLGPGTVYRWWTRAEETAMPEHDLPEIRRTDLASTTLDLRLWGARDPARFDWFEAPDAAALERADALLVRLGALDPVTLRPTPRAAAIARIPAHPRVARLLLEAAERGIPEDGALLAALLSERDLLGRSIAARGDAAKLPTGPSDLLARRDLFLDAERGRGAGVDRAAFHAVARARDQFRRMLGERGRRGASASAEVDVEEACLRAILAAYPDRVARRRRRGAAESTMVGGRGLVLAPESVVRDAELFVVLDADLGRRGAAAARATVRQASAIERAWLDEVAGSAIVRGSETFFDAERGRVVARKVVRFDDLVLEEGETGAPDPEAAAALLLDAAKKEPRRALGLTRAAESLVGRLRALAEWMPELELPPHDDADLVDALAPWVQGRTTLDELTQIDLVQALLARLNRKQREALETQAPAALTVPSGMRRELTYAPGKPPTLAVKLQELFGLAETPRVGGGRVPVLLHLLSPGGTPVQVTQDLRSFWNGAYAQVRKDLRGRYPRHPWPEDPWNAAPTHRAKPRGT
ncbi:MAG TPA: ATP-dependent helicase HrpB [Planctomycetota bacterium]|nr:ATP-dependent helicase HrpB [Planctomycetota bacterium]